MVLKYLINDYPIQTLYFGIANVVANGLVMLRYVHFKYRSFPLILLFLPSPVSGCFALCFALLCVCFWSLMASSSYTSSIVLWVSQNIEDDYTYNLAL